MQPILEVKNLCKSYRLGQVGATTLRDDLWRFWYWLRGKNNPFQAGKNILSERHGNDWVQALSDVSFTVQPGERVGIIGKNGAGKSTLLKILSRITAPTSGEAILHGRMAALLEVGTGFHPEFTGKENIYLNGTMLGMSKNEIDAKLDAIVDFSGVGRYLDTPAKRYSSGMRVRLGFAVAAHLEPDILMVDEVLAVGDAEFQNKAVGKMEEISDNSGRTILFVSHNMNSIKSVCNRCILVEQGSIKFDGSPGECIDIYYRNQRSQGNKTKQLARTGHPEGCKIFGLRTLDINGNPKSAFNVGETMQIQADVEMMDVLTAVDLRAAIIHPSNGVICVLANDATPATDLASEGLTATFTWESVLSPGKYEIKFTVRRGRTRLDVVSGLWFEVLNVHSTPSSSILFGSIQAKNYSVKIESTKSL